MYRSMAAGAGLIALTLVLHILHESPGYPQSLAVIVWPELILYLRAVV